MDVPVKIQIEDVETTTLTTTTEWLNLDLTSTIWITKTVKLTTPTVSTSPVSELEILISKRSESDHGLKGQRAINQGSSKDVGIAIGITFTVVAMLIMLIALWYFLHRRKSITVTNTWSQSKMSSEGDSSETASSPSFKERTLIEYVPRPPYLEIDPLQSLTQVAVQNPATERSNWKKRLSDEFEFSHFFYKDKYSLPLLPIRQDGEEYDDSSLSTGEVTPVFAKNLRKLKLVPPSLSKQNTDMRY